MAKKYHVLLTAQEREALQALVSVQNLFPDFARTLILYANDYSIGDIP